jgi:CheY-like chemotaxis protein/HPt (histidine-containing phosphotransfer) domain-containing protein
MISDAVNLNMLRLGEKPIKFYLEANKNLPVQLYGDELRIKQILNNVLSNAFKYTTEGAVKLSVGKVSYSPTELNLVFTISDTGQGMTSEQVHGIFDEFTRFNHASNLEIEGAGLGMSIVKNLLNMMQGKISVVSEPGMGSIFTIQIPQKTAEKTMLGTEVAKNIKNLKPIEHRKSIQTEWEAMPYGKVLVVDDTYLNLYVIKGMLAPYELQAEFVDSGYAAIDKIVNDSAYDLILMDQMMPQMDGIETMHRLRQMGCTTPIVAFSANAIVGQEEKFLDKGFDDFISKPIQSTHLNSILYKYVHNTHVKSKRISAERISKTQIDHIELCKEFAKSQKNVIIDMKRATKLNDYNTAQLLAHTLRSLAGLIGESKLMLLAGQVESSFRNKRLPIDTLNALSDEVEKVISAINEKSNSEPKIPPPTEEEKKKLFATLETLISQNNAEAITLIPTLEAIPGTEEIISNIENYNFNLALQNLAKLR